MLQSNQISFSPSLTDDRVACLNRLGVARYTKVWLTWEEPWWRSDPGRPFIICVDAGDTHMSAVMCEDVSSSKSCSRRAWPGVTQTLLMLIPNEDSRPS